MLEQTLRQVAERRFNKVCSERCLHTVVSGDSSARVRLLNHDYMVACVSNDRYSLAELLLQKLHKRRLLHWLRLTCNRCWGH